MLTREDFDHRGSGNATSTGRRVYGRYDPLIQRKVRPDWFSGGTDQECRGQAGTIGEGLRDFGITAQRIRRSRGWNTTTIGLDGVDPNTKRGRGRGHGVVECVCHGDAAGKIGKDHPVGPRPTVNESDVTQSLISYDAEERRYRIKPILPPWQCCARRPDLTCDAVAPARGRGRRVW